MVLMALWGSLSMLSPDRQKYSSGAPEKGLSLTFTFERCQHFREGNLQPLAPQLHCKHPEEKLRFLIHCVHNLEERVGTPSSGQDGINAFLPTSPAQYS